MTDQSNWLNHHFLMATPWLEDPRFGGTLTYLCEHNEQGAMGLVVNRPLDLHLADVFEQLELPMQQGEVPVYAGGPVQTERGFVLHRPVGHWKNSLAITDTLAMTTSRDILHAMAVGEGPQDFLMVLGYAGWGAGQLEQELESDAWLAGPADERILFDCPARERLPAALKHIGVDLSHLSGGVGHA